MNWLQKIAQKPFPMVGDRPHGRCMHGWDHLDEIMTQETADTEEQKYPSVEGLGSGNFSGVTKVRGEDLKQVIKGRDGNMYVVKYTDHPDEIEAAKKAQGHTSPYIIKVYSVQQVQFAPDQEIWSIISDYAQPPNLEERKIISKIHVNLVFGDRVIHPVEYYLDTMHNIVNRKAIPTIHKAYVKFVKGVIGSGFTINDAHGNNVGWRIDNGRVTPDLVLMDLGFSLPLKEVTLDEQGLPPRL